MLKRGVVVLFVFLLSVSFVLALEEDPFADIGDVELEEEAGLTPDDAFYFLDTLMENLLVGNSPEKALAYKEEKIAEVRQMIEEGKVEEAKEALERAEKHGIILEREVSPEIEKRARESSKAVKEVLEKLNDKLEGEEWKEVREDIEKQSKMEDKIALTAKITTQIKDLCGALSELNPIEYSRVCKTSDDAPEWQRKLDRKLTKEQKKEAREFFKILSSCFENPRECECDKISISSFAEQCNEIAPLAVACMEGDEEACEKEEEFDIDISVLPSYLQEVLEEVEDRYDEAKYDHYVPKECQEAGALDRESCMKVMFKANAPEECQKALEEGRIDPKNEREAREQCDKIMFELEAPEECIKAGLDDHKECGKYMFQLEAPQECLDAGLTGEGKVDWKRCEAIRFRVEASQECLDAGLDGSGRDDWKKCDAIRFEIEAPEACLEAGIDSNDRKAWDKCQIVEFKDKAAQECLDAGLDGSGRDDWKKCNKINFKHNADPRCIEAGLDGSGRDDWKKCEEMSEDDSEKRGSPRGPDCNALPVTKQLDCFKEWYDNMFGDRRESDLEDDDRGERREDDDSGHGDQRCAAIYCRPGTYCEEGRCIQEESYEGNECEDGCEDECGDKSWDCSDGRCECFDDSPNDYEESECKDGCSQECGDQNTDCVNDKCVCLGYGENGPPTEPEPEPSPIPEPEPSPTLEPEPESEPEPAPSDNSGVTGGIVLDNEFLKYYYKW